MSLPYSATVLVNWLPVICMPSPESPAKRITACSITSRLVLPEGISINVDMMLRYPRAEDCPPWNQGEWSIIGERRGTWSAGAEAPPPGADRPRIAHRYAPGVTCITLVG